MIMERKFQVSLQGACDASELVIQLPLNDGVEDTDAYSGGGGWDGKKSGSPHQMQMASPTSAINLNDLSLYGKQQQQLQPPSAMATGLNNNSNSNSTIGSPLSPVPISSQKSSLILNKLASSATTITSHNLSGYANESFATNNNNYNEKRQRMLVCEADMNVWELIDRVFPLKKDGAQDLSVDDAFVVGVPSSHNNDQFEQQEQLNQIQPIVENQQYQQQYHQQQQRRSTPYQRNTSSAEPRFNATSTATTTPTIVRPYTRRYHSISSSEIKPFTTGPPPISGRRSLTPSTTYHRRSQSNPPDQPNSSVLLLPASDLSHSTPGSYKQQQQQPLISPLIEFPESELPSATVSAGSTDTLCPPSTSTKEQQQQQQQQKHSQPSPQPTLPTNPPSTTLAKVLPSVNVLVVEDNQINLRILSAHLRRHKIRHDTAKNGQEAIDKWRQGGFHLVLMDIQLPVLSGLDAAKEIRRLERINNIGVISLDQTLAIILPKEDLLDSQIFRSPVIIVALTASNLKQDKTEALAAGCNDYLTKPVNFDWLLNKITEWGCMQALIDFDGWKLGEKRMINDLRGMVGLRPSLGKIGSYGSSSGTNNSSSGGGAGGGSSISGSSSSSSSSGSNVTNIEDKRVDK